MNKRMNNIAANKGDFDQYTVRALVRLLRKENSMMVSMTEDQALINLAIMVGRWAIVTGYALYPEQCEYHALAEQLIAEYWELA